MCLVQSCRAHGPVDDISDHPMTGSSDHPIPVSLPWAKPKEI